VIASNLIELRQARSLSRPQLAYKANMSRANLWGIETGKTAPSILTLQKLSDALGVGLARLLSKSDVEMVVLEDNFVQSIRPLLPHLNNGHRAKILETLRAAPTAHHNAQKEAR
jgi:transcriptional regulator with XRE-family HTH domain